MTYLAKCKSCIVAISDFSGCPSVGMSLGQIGFSTTRLLHSAFTKPQYTSESLALFLLLSLHTSYIYCFDPLSLSAPYSKFALLFDSLETLGLLPQFMTWHLSRCLLYPGSHSLLCYVSLFERFPFPAICTAPVLPCPRSSSKRQSAWRTLSLFFHTTLSLLALFPI